MNNGIKRRSEDIDMPSYTDLEDSTSSEVSLLETRDQYDNEKSRKRVSFKRLKNYKSSFYIGLIILQLFIFYNVFYINKESLLTSSQNGKSLDFLHPSILQKHDTKGVAISNPPIVLGVFTTQNPKDRLLRDIHRRTHFRYKNSCTSVAEKKSCQVLWKFVMGTTENEEWTLAVKKENETFGDIIVLDIEENMNKGKTYTWWKFISRAYPLAKFYGKADTDTFVWTINLAKDLGNISNPFGTYYGRFSCGHMIGCSEHQKFVSGGFQVLSKDLVEWISHPDNEFVKSRIMGYEDLNTGIWLHQGHRVVNLRSPCPDQVEDMYNLYTNTTCGDVFVHWVKDPELFEKIYTDKVSFASN